MIIMPDKDSGTAGSVRRSLRWSLNNRCSNRLLYLKRRATICRQSRPITTVVKRSPVLMNIPAGSLCRIRTVQTEVDCHWRYCEPCRASLKNSNFSLRIFFNTDYSSKQYQKRVHFLLKNTKIILNKVKILLAQKLRGNLYSSQFEKANVSVEFS